MRNYGLLGKNIGYSLSPVLHQEIFRLKGQQGRYGLFSTDFPDFGSQIGELIATDTNFNVTIPYKQQILPYLTELTPQAQAMGAVNTVQVHHGRLYGHNTDCDGLAFALKHLGFVSDRVLILGCGGGAKSAVAALKTLGISEIFVCGRNQQHLTSFIRQTGAQAYTGQKGITGIINATPVGTLGTCANYPVKLSVFTDLCWCYDMVYNPYQTPLLAFCHKHGLPCRNGLLMLAAQGAYANQIWTSSSFTDTEILNLEQHLMLELCKRHLNGGNLFLCGFMAAGKTTMGQQLAAQLGYAHMDTDKIIEERAGTTISQIFQSQGEGEFRLMEEMLSKEFCPYKNTVFSLGGGFITSEQALNAIKSQHNAILIFIDTPFEVIQRRLQNDATRPLAANFHQLYQNRLELYKKSADIIFRPTCTCINEDCIGLLKKLQTTNGIFVF